MPTEFVNRTLVGWLVNRLVTAPQLGQVPGDESRRQKKQAGVEQRQPVITNLGEQSKENRAAGGNDTADVVAEPGARCAEQRGKERRQIHSEQGEQALKKSRRSEERRVGKERRKKM